MIIRADSCDPIEHHRGLDSIPDSLALTTRGPGCNGVRSVSERGLGIDRVLQLREIAGASVQKLLLEHDLDHYVDAVSRYVASRFTAPQSGASSDDTSDTGAEVHRRPLVNSGTNERMEPPKKASTAVWMACGLSNSLRRSVVCIARKI